MPWITERVTPEPDGVNKDFTMSYTPAEGLLWVYFPFTPVVITQSAPQEMECVVQNGTSLHFGLAPVNGRTPWVIYWYEGEDQPDQHEFIYVTDENGNIITTLNTVDEDIALTDNSGNYIGVNL